MLDNILASLLKPLERDPDMLHYFHVFCDEYRSVLEWLIEHNTPPHMGPETYHNTRHLIGVAFLGYYLTGGERITVLAAFIHDFRYINQQPDAVNIAHSLAQAEEEGFFALPVVNAADADVRIRKAVEATEYDFAHPMPENLDAWQYSLRDADQLYATVFFDVDVYQGLEAEVGPKVNVRGMAFLQRNAQYVMQDRLYTSLAKGIQHMYLPQCLLAHVSCAQLYTN